jgi:hypothetical protein
MRPASLNNAEARVASQAKQDLEDAILEIVPTGRSAPPEKQQTAHLEVNPGLAVGMRVQSIPALERHDAVTVVIRIASSLKATGIIVDATGVVASAPGGLFDDTYKVVGINGKQFVSGMESQARSPTTAVSMLTNP